jgi:hypothetical protein
MNSQGWSLLWLVCLFHQNLRICTYVFVALQGLGQRPSFHIVPSKVVADYTSSSHSEWLKGKKPDGGRRKDSSIRKFDDYEDRFLEAWALIQL